MDTQRSLHIIHFPWDSHRIFLVSYFARYRKEMVDIPYWDEFYEKGEVPLESSTFAKSVLHKIKKDEALIELGCGNGRDAYFFAAHGIPVYAIDISHSVTKLRVENGNPTFIHADFTNLANSFQNKSYGTIYSRFTLHSV